MSNYLGRKPDFTPSVYTRYFERTETPKSSNGHIYFEDNDEQKSDSYQLKRDLIFKRLFPSKYADTNDDNNKSQNEQINQNGINKNNSLNNATAQSLGDFIPLSNDNSSTEKKKPSSSQTDVFLSSSDEYEEDILIEESLPTAAHELIVGHVHPRTTIENIRAILIRELYQRTSDPHTEWLKCKMNIPKDYINPKYYADFQRRYRKDIKKNTMKKNKSNTMNNNHHITDLTTTEKTAIQIDDTFENDDIIVTSPIVHSNDSSTQPEFIILDSDEDDKPDQDKNSSYFIDRSSHSSTAISQPTTISNDDYQKEDSKYAQLPARNTSSSPSVIRPILSKHQRRKKTNSNSNSSQPLVSAIDRIIDQMDQTETFNNTQTLEQQNLLIKQIKKRKKKKKKKNQIQPTSN